MPNLCPKILPVSSNFPVLLVHRSGGYGRLADIIIEKGIEEGFIDEDDLD